MGTNRTRVHPYDNIVQLEDKGIKMDMQKNMLMQKLWENVATNLQMPSQAS